MEKSDIRQEYEPIHKLLKDGWEARIRLHALPELIANGVKYKIIIQKGYFSLWIQQNNKAITRVSRMCTIKALSVQEIIASLAEQEAFLFPSEEDVNWYNTIICRIDPQDLFSLKKGWKHYRPSYSWGEFYENTNEIYYYRGGYVIKACETNFGSFVDIAYNGKDLHIPYAFQHEISLLLTDNTNTIDFWKYLIDTSENFPYWFNVVPED